MRLNVQTDYALRLLMYLAVNRARLCTLTEISTHYDISRNHLVKVAAQLSGAGFVDAVRGRGGGLELARAPKAITVADVVRTMENDFQIAECFGEQARCVAGPGCRLKRVLEDALAAFLEVLDGYSLHDLTRRNAKLRSLLLEAS